MTAQISMTDTAVRVPMLDREAFAADIFALNPRPTVRERRVGNEGHRVLIVDDFYDDPERVLGLTEELEFFDDPRITLSFPGKRAIADAELQDVLHAIVGYADKQKAPENDNLLLSIQGMWGNTPLRDRQRIPHNDPTVTALLYLNQSQDCSGGTGLYRHRPTGIELLPITPDERMIALARELGYSARQLETRYGYVAMTERVIFNTAQANPDGSMLNGGNDYWELMDLIEMRFNRLVMYDGRIPHTAFVEPGTFEHVPRFAQMLSLKLDNDSW